MLAERRRRVGRCIELGLHLDEGWLPRLCLCLCDGEQGRRVRHRPEGSGGSAAPPLRRGGRVSPFQGHVDGRAREVGKEPYV